MTERPLVSVVVPTRDRPELAARAIASALGQTYESLEVVVVDDGSADPFELPADLRSDPRVRVLRHDEPHGPATARNEGVRATQGPLIAFLDDDDSWRPTKIERQVPVLEGSDEHVAAVETGFDLWRGDELVLRYVPELDRDLARTLLEKPVLQPSTVLIRRSAFEALGGFDPSLRRVEDWELWVRFADRYRAAVLPEVLVDRIESHPADELEWYREFVRRMQPRIEAVPPGERDRISAVHLLVEAHLLFVRGEGRAGRAKALLAARTYPRAGGRSLLYLVRSLVGERVWSSGKALLVRLRRSRTSRAGGR